MNFQIFIGIIIILFILYYLKNYYKTYNKNNINIFLIIIPICIGIYYIYNNEYVLIDNSNISKASISDSISESILDIPYPLSTDSV